jgi:hypothetical protein
MDQIKLILGENPSDEFLEVRDLLIEDLPEVFK